MKNLSADCTHSQASLNEAPFCLLILAQNVSCPFRDLFSTVIFALYVGGFAVIVAPVQVLKGYLGFPSTRRLECTLR